MRMLSAFLPCAAMVVSAFASEREIRSVPCDEWEWMPFQFIELNEYRKVRASGEEPNFEHKGPILRKPVGWIGSVGWASTNAVKGLAYELKKQKTAVSIGFHAPFGGLFDPDKDYRVEFWVRGEGSYAFSSWHYIYDLRKNASRHWKLAKVVGGKLPAEWTKVSVPFRLPEPPEGCRTEKRNSAAFLIEPNTHFMMDEFKVYEVEK